MSLDTGNRLGPCEVLSSVREGGIAEVYQPTDAKPSLTVGNRLGQCDPTASTDKGAGLLCAIVGLIVLLAPRPVAGQSMTPWGHPDLQGLWTNQTPVPLERPEALADKTFFTEEEAAEFERTALERLVDVFGPTAALSGELSEIWLDTQDGRVGGSRRTSLVSDPPDGRIPFTQEGKERWDTTPRGGRESSADGPEDRSLDERCITSDGLLLPNPFASNYYRIFQTPDHVVILSEVMHVVRIIPLDQRPHIDPGIGLWEGDSRGRWEERTLVVETTNFNGKKRFRGATERVRMVERFTRLDADTIDYRLTVTDPASFERPWTLENPLRRAKGPMFEFACHEGNYGMTGILAGARAEEQK